jgi:hypothetical protein
MLMHLHEATVVTEAANKDEANDKMQNGWTLLAAVPGAGSSVKYVLGKKELPKPEPRQRTPMEEQAIAQAQEALKDVK